MHHQSLTFSTLDVSKITRDEWAEMKSEISNRFGIREDNGMSEHVLKSHVAGRWLLIKMLKHAGISEDQLSTFSVGKFGKPFLTHNDCFFNLSHSANIVAGITSGLGKVGIDVEVIKPIALEHYQDCFSVSEWESIRENSNPDRRALELWTIKESVLKADGRGLQQSMSDVILENNSATILNENAKWFWKTVSLEGFACCVSSEFEIGEIRMM
jgi:4'-phosphopantetheinyl transferase